MTEKIVIVAMDDTSWTGQNAQMWPDPPGCAGDPVLSQIPEGCAGHELYKIAALRTGITPDQWLSSIEQINLVRSWDPYGAVDKAIKLEPYLKNKTVLLIGKSVLFSFAMCEMDKDESSINLMEPLRWMKKRDWCWIPHTSKRNLWYHEPIHRECVAIFLADLLYECKIWDGINRSEPEVEEVEETESEAEITHDEAA